MRRRRVTYRPSRAQAGFGVVVGVIFVCIGIFLVIPAGGLFGIFWTLMAAGMTIYNAYMAFGKKYIGPEINIEDEDASGAAPEARAKSGETIEDRLNKLTELYDRGIITYDEYKEKRGEILDEL